MVLRCVYRLLLVLDWDLEIYRVRSLHGCRHHGWLHHHRSRVIIGNSNGSLLDVGHRGSSVVHRLHLIGNLLSGKFGVQVSHLQLLVSELVSQLCNLCNVMNYNKYLFLETLFLLLDFVDLFRKGSDRVGLPKSTLKGALSVLEASFLYLVHLFVLE